MDVKEYKMLPIKRPEGAQSVKLPSKRPTLGAAVKRNHYRIVHLKDEGHTAVICADMSKQELTVRDVNVRILGYKSVEIGDIIAYQSDDVAYERPIITHRHHQLHTHPDHLVAPEEK